MLAKPNWSPLKESKSDSLIHLFNQQPSFLMKLGRTHIQKQMVEGDESLPDI
jgi:hypothetical protein